MNTKNSEIKEKIKRTVRVIRNWLRKKLRRWFKPWLAPKQKKYQVLQNYVSPEDNRPLDSTDYEYFFMQLLEGVDHDGEKRKLNECSLLYLRKVQKQNGLIG